MEWHLKFLIESSFIILLSLPASAGFDQKDIALTHNRNKRVIKVEIAETPQQHSLGLMNRKKMAKDSGMLFVFDSELVREFWMKNTLIKLDIAYFDKNKKIIDIQQMQAQKSVMQTDYPTYPSKAPAQYALEMNEGWFEKNNFPIGTKFKFVSGPSSK